MKILTNQSIRVVIYENRFRSNRLLTLLNFCLIFLDDFYEFSCGGFLKSKRIPDEQPRIDVFDDLRDTLAYNVAG